MEYEHEALGKAAAKMEKTIDAINREFINIRAGRANPKILDKVTVSYTHLDVYKRQGLMSASLHFSTEYAKRESP